MTRRGGSDAAEAVAPPAGEVFALELRPEAADGGTAGGRGVASGTRGGRKSGGRVCVCGVARISLRAARDNSAAVCVCKCLSWNVHLVMVGEV